MLVSKERKEGGDTFFCQKKDQKLGKKSIALKMKKGAPANIFELMFSLRERTVAFSGKRCSLKLEKSF